MTTRPSVWIAFTPLITAFALGAGWGALVWIGWHDAQMTAFAGIAGSLAGLTGAGIGLGEYAQITRLHGNQAEVEEPEPEPEREHTSFLPHVYAAEQRGLIMIDPPIPLPWQLMRRFAWGVRHEHKGLAEGDWKGILTRDSQYKPLTRYMLTHGLAEWVNVNNHRLGMRLRGKGADWLDAITGNWGPPPQYKERVKP
jgi:hypothetical protein